MAFAFTLTDIIPATPGQIYDAWLHSRGHTARGRIIYGVGWLHLGGQSDAGARTAHRAGMAHHAIHHGRTRFTNRGAAGTGSAGYQAYIASYQRSGRPHRLPERRVAGALL